MARVFSGIKPSGEVHLGNLVGAISRWVSDQQPEHIFCVVDLHALTLQQDPAALRAWTLDLAAWLFAAGLDPDIATVFVQSHVEEHTALSWLLECTAGMGELGRMTQFKDKSEGRDSVSVGLFTYPVLQAADILAYQTEQVPVGADQRQHIELARDLAQRFNSRYGQTFTLPQAVTPKAGARVMDLQQPTRKMSKSQESPQGTIVLGEDEATTRRKVMRAVTDSGSEVTAGPDKPALSNLLDLFAAVTGAEPAQVSQQFAGKGYGEFKTDLAEAVNGYLRPVRLRHAELMADPGALRAVLREGADRARSTAAETLATAQERVGLVPA